MRYVFCDWDSQFFFFKQKTAYEMRISDWSSDVCSSDLPQIDMPPLEDVVSVEAPVVKTEPVKADAATLAATLLIAQIGRASCRKECVSTCRSRWSPYH